MRDEGGVWYQTRLEPHGLGWGVGFYSEHNGSPLKGLVAVNRKAQRPV